MNTAFKRIRTVKDIRQKELAKKAAVSVRAIQNYESGLRRPGIDIAQRLARELDVNVAELFPVEGNGKEK